MKIIYKNNIFVRLLSFILFLSLVWAEIPDWEEDIGGYQFIATLAIGVVLNDGVQLGEEGDLFAAFDDDGNVRGLSQPSQLLIPNFGPYVGTPVWEMTIRSNSAGDIILFKYYDVSEDAILAISETYEFAINDQLGNLVTGAIEFNIADCVDDPEGIVGNSCDTILNSFGMSCDVEFAGTLISEACPATCNACGSDDGPSGCDLPDMSLSILEDGSVLYNTSESIGGFQFYIDGDDIVVNGASGGAAEETGFTITSSGGTNKVLGFSMTGSSIPPGCGTLVEVEVDGISTGLTAIVMSDPDGGGLVFEYLNCGDDGSNCLDIMRHLFPDEFGINTIYPNPFNPVAQIQYDISSFVLVKVQIFDLRGRAVARLINKYQRPGRYNITWDASNHASGMYFVEMMIRHGDDLTVIRNMHKILYLK